MWWNKYIINGFFGWKHLKWVIVELIKMYSMEKSFFSYKRFQVGTAYFIFTQGAMMTLTKYVNSAESFVVWCVPVLLICGYTLDKIQKEKINPPTEEL